MDLQDIQETKFRQAKPGQCHFYIPKKNRFCSFTPRDGEDYCAMHSQGKIVGDQVIKRIPCPLDPKHTVIETELQKHLAKCNAGKKREEKLPFFRKGINLARKVFNKKSSFPGKEMKKPLFGPVALKILRALRHISQVNIDSLDNYSLCPNIFVRSESFEEIISSIPQNERFHFVLREKHLYQQSALIEIGRRMGLMNISTCDKSNPRITQERSLEISNEKQMLPPSFKFDASKHLFIEFGAGKGGLSHAILLASPIDRVFYSRPTFLLIERESRRLVQDRHMRWWMKKKQSEQQMMQVSDNRTKEEDNFVSCDNKESVEMEQTIEENEEEIVHRIRIDISDVILGKIDGVMDYIQPKEEILSLDQSTSLSPPPPSSSSSSSSCPTTHSAFVPSFLISEDEKIVEKWISSYVKSEQERSVAENEQSTKEGERIIEDSEKIFQKGEVYKEEMNVEDEMLCNKKEKIILAKHEKDDASCNCAKRRKIDECDQIEQFGDPNISCSNGCAKCQSKNNTEKYKVKNKKKPAKDNSAIHLPPHTGIVAIGKHLCGGATDITLRALENFVGGEKQNEENANEKKDGIETSSGSEDELRKESEKFNCNRRLDMLRGIMIATCCHHRCTYDQYINPTYLEEYDIGEEEFKVITRMAAWGCGGEKMKKQFVFDLKDKEEGSNDPLKLKIKINEEVKMNKEKREKEESDESRIVQMKCEVSNDEKETEANPSNQIPKLKKEDEEIFKLVQELKEPLESDQVTLHTIGRACKLFLDFGRVEAIRKMFIKRKKEHTPSSLNPPSVAGILHYCPQEITPENTLLYAILPPDNSS